MPSKKPLGGYRRLTSDRHGNKIGYDVQTESAEGWAARNGYTIGHWYTDPDVTAGDEDVYREEYEQMLRDLEAGLLGGIIVMYMDRLTRLTYEYERTLRIARRANAIIVCAGDNTIAPGDNEDWQRMKVMMAQSELNQMKRRIKANKQKRSKGGEYHGGGRRPYGFMGPEYDESGEKVINTGLVGVMHVPFEVARLREAAQRIAWDGETYLDVINDWHASTPPVYGATGAPWNTKTLQAILTSPRMVGRRIHRTVDPDSGKLVESEVRAVWEPVLDERTWLQLKATRKTLPGKGGRSFYALSGLALCGRCDQPLTGATRKYHRGGGVASVRTYRCRSGANDKARGHCGKLSVLAEDVEQMAMSLAFERLRLTKGAVAGVAEESELQRQMAEASEEIDYCDGELGALDEAQASRQFRLPVRSWLAARGPLEEQRNEAVARLKALQAMASVPTPAGRDFDDLVSWFDALTVGQKSKFARAHIEQVKVLAPGRSGRYFQQDRVKVRLAGAKQAD